MSEVSHKKYRVDEQLRSDISGTLGHKSEFTRCVETRAVLLPTETEQCAVTRKLVAPGVLETCSVLNKNVLPNQLEESVVAAVQQVVYEANSAERSTYRDSAITLKQALRRRSLV